MLRGSLNIDTTFFRWWSSSRSQKHEVIFKLSELYFFYSFSSMRIYHFCNNKRLVKKEKNKIPQDIVLLEADWHMGSLHVGAELKWPWKTGKSGQAGTAGSHLLLHQSESGRAMMATAWRTWAPTQKLLLTPSTPSSWARSITSTITHPGGWSRKIKANQGYTKTTFPFRSQPAAPFVVVT